MSKKRLRSDSKTITKEFGQSNSLPLRPLTKADILARYNSLKELDGNRIVAGRQIASKLVIEIEELYQKFGLKTITKSNAITKVLRIKKEYYYTRKKESLNASFIGTEIVSFKAKRQPREVLHEDIEWYEAKLNGSAGSLGSVDRKAAKRKEYRDKRKCSLANKMTERDLGLCKEEIEDDDGNQSPPTVDLTSPNSCQQGEGYTPRKKCKKNDWTPLVETALRWNVSSEAVQEILMSFAKVVGLDSRLIPSDTTIFRKKREATTGKRDDSLASLKTSCDAYVLQFDGKETHEAVLISGLSSDGAVKTMPLEIMSFKSHPTGKKLGESLANMPLDHNKVIGLVCDTTTVNSGTGKKGGSCFWYQEITDSPCFVVMCRIHSQECIAGEALKILNSAIFGTSTWETGSSSTVSSLKTICHNLRELSGLIDFFEDVKNEAIFKWPIDFEPIDGEPFMKHMTDMQKLFCLLVSRRELKKRDIARKFVPVGVRWLGYLCSLLHVCVSLDVVLDKLERIDNANLPSKTKVGLKDNLIRCLRVLQKNPIVIKSIYEFSKIHFLCWRRAVISNGPTVFQTAVGTSQLYAEVGIRLGFDKAYFESINRHLHNADGIFMPLSLDIQCMHAVYRILKTGLEKGWMYNPAKLKDRIRYNFTKDELCHLNTEKFMNVPGFPERVFSSPLFYHIRESIEKICYLYDQGNPIAWESKSLLIPGHNQQCERLIGDMKRSRDINTLVTISNTRQLRKRVKGNVNKGIEYM